MLIIEQPAPFKTLWNVDSFSQDVLDLFLTMLPFSVLSVVSSPLLLTRKNKEKV